MISNNFENEENVDDAIISIFRKNNVDFDKLLSRTNIQVPDGSTFYDGTIEEIWRDPLER